MRRFLVPALLLFSISGSWADAVQRAPVNIDYADFLKNADSRCNSCQLLLTGRADRSHPSSLVYVRAKREKDGATEIQAGYFEVKNANLPSEGSKTSLTDYLAFGIAPEKLKESQTSNFYTGEALRSIATNSLLMKGTTAIVSRVNPLEAASPTPIDTSILIRNAGNADFIVEQASDIPRFARNLALVRDRRYSQQVTLFDFTPRSRAAMKQMELDGTVLPWRFFSRRISGIFYSYQKPEALGRRSKEALLQRLQTPAGGVIVLYAHSDGKEIWLDTEDGVMRLSQDDIARAGKMANGLLPPIILLNCETRSALAPAFLDAGSPFVATTDQQLDLFEAGSFVSQFAKALYIGNEDVLDAYFTAQQIANPNRLRPIAENAEIPKP